MLYTVQIILLTLLSISPGRYGNPLQIEGPITLDPDKVITQYLHDVWQIEEGLPQSTIMTIEQTNDGYLWLGTEEGLVRFNGVSFDIYDRKNTQSFASSQDIRALLVDREGTLWIGTGGGLIRYENDQFYVLDDQAELHNKVVNSLVEDEDGAVWVGTADAGLFVCAKDLCTRRTLSDLAEPPIIRTLLIDKKGTLWVGSDQGLRYLPEGSSKGSENIEALAGQFVLSLYEDGDEGFWIGTRDGLFRKKGGQVNQVDLRPDLPEEGVWSMWQDASKNLWVGLGQSGLVRIHNDRYEYFPVDQGLSQGRVLSLYEDFEGSLWIGTEGGGLNRLRSGAFTTFTEQEGLSSDAVLTVYEDPSGSLWVGTEGGGLNQYENEEFTHYTTADGLSNDIVTSVAGSSQGGIWVGTLGGGLNLFRNGRFSTITAKDGLPSDAIYSLYEDDSGKLWGGTDKGLMSVYGDEIESLSLTDGLPSNFITAILRDRMGVLWVGTYDAGLVRYENGEFSIAVTEEELGSSVVLALHEDKEGAIWIGTYGGGLSHYKDGKVERYSTQDGFFDDNIFQILEDDFGYLWMGCNKGVFRVKKDELAANRLSGTGLISVMAFDQDDGLKSREINGGVQPAGWKSVDGRLWFPTIKGITVVDPAKLYLDSPPPVVLEDVMVDQEKAIRDKPLVLKPGTEKIEFEFAAVTFVGGSKVNYQYRLAGLEDDWSELSNHRRASYTNLAPGDYTFHVVAQNSNGVWNREGVQFSFEQKPFYYQSPFFWIFTALGVGLMAYWGNHINVRRLKVQQTRLQEAVDERTRNLQLAKDKIEKQAGELMAALRDKEVLMQEVHHRVKNNLQVITSLLALQSERVQDEETSALFQECRNRIKSMAMIHEQLYQSDDLEQIDISGYLSSISYELARSYNAPLRDIDVEVMADSGSLGVERAIPCGLIVNELVSNALKHAFPDGQAGKITIRFSTAGEMHHLSVEDNGVGIPEELEIAKSRTLGMKLIATLVKKLKGTINVLRDNRSFVEIMFPVVRS